MTFMWRRSFTLAFVIVSCAATAKAQMLVQNVLWTQPPDYVLDKQFANSHWNVDLFCAPLRGSISYMKLNGHLTANRFAAFVDPCWNRLIYVTDNYNVVRSYGGPGSGTGEFKRPQSIIVSSPTYDDHQMSSYYNIYVADTDNNRIQRLKYFWESPESGLIHLQYFASPVIDHSVDIDLDNSGDYWPDNNDAVWIACQNNTIVRYPVAGGAVIIYGSTGAGIGQFNGITAIACGHNPSTWANDSAIYVADAGNSRIVKLLRNGTNITWMTSLEHGSANLITDLGTDVVGHLYATTSNGHVLKFTRDLIELGIIGSQGISQNQFNHPTSISLAGGYLNNGGVMFTESWTEQTGIKGYTIGTDIYDMNVNSTWVSSHCEFVFYFTLADYSWVTVEVRKTNGTLLKRFLLQSLTWSGLNTITWNGRDQNGIYVPTGNYRFIVTAQSIYGNEETGQASAIVTDTLNFASCSPACTWLVGDADGNGARNVSDAVRIVNYIFSGGLPPNPHPVGSGDADCNHMVNISDAVYLIRHIFEGGPAPTCDCSQYL
jgi:hypothetical protein